MKKTYNISEINWVDCSIDQIKFKFQGVELFFKDSFDNSFKIIAQYIITVKCFGLWDENTIEKVSVNNSCNFIESSKNVIKKYYGEDAMIAGENIKIDDSWSVLHVELIDGAEILIAGNDFKVIKPPQNILK